MKEWGVINNLSHSFLFKLEVGPLARYVQSRVAHAPGMPGTFSPAADFKGNR